VEGLAQPGFDVGALLAAALAGAALTGVGALLVRRGERGGRVGRLAARARELTAGKAPRPITSPDVLAGSDELAELARAFHAMELKLLEEREAREAYLDRALDELKKPLALLGASLEMALNRRREVPELAAALRDSQREAARISRLASRIVLLQTMRRKVRLRPADVCQVVRMVQQAALPAAMQQGLRLQVEAPPELSLRCDPDALALALTELVTNAMQASRKGGAVRLSVETAGDKVRLGVVDEGPGVARDRRRAIFEPFNRGPLAWSPAGMGLALVREVARGHGGEAKVVDEEVGAHLEIELPS